MAIILLARKAATPRLGGGFSLLELLLALSIAAALMAVAVPSAKDAIVRRQAESSVQRVLAAVRFARMSAVARGETITVCASDPHGACALGGVYGAEVAAVQVFRDSNQNRKVDGDELLLRRVADLRPITLRWRLSNRAFLRFNPVGEALEFGSIRICSPAGDSAIVINLAGRSYVRQEDRGC